MQTRETHNGRGRSKGSFVAGFLIGGLFGAGIALLQAPRSGAETRRMIEERALELQQKAEQTAEEARSQAKQVGDQLSQSAKRVQEKAQETAEKARSEAEQDRRAAV